MTLAYGVLLSIRQLPRKSKDILGHRLENFRVDRIGGVGRLMKVRMDTTADNSDGRDTRLFERHMIAAGKESIHVELVGEPCRLSRL